MLRLKTLASSFRRNRRILRFRNVAFSFKQICTTVARPAFESSDFSFLDCAADDDPNEFNELRKLMRTSFQPETGGLHTFVVQPFIKWGPLKKHDITPDLQLEESVSLINTLASWTVEAKETVPLYTFDKYTFFGSGKLDELKLKIARNKNISAMFISVNMLTPAQHEYLESVFSIPVYDRYLIVMQIFREHAISAEAKLQIALAELPYLYSRMSHVHSASLSRIGGAATRISGTTIHTLEDRKKLMLHKYESRLKSAAEKLRRHRETSRVRRKTAEHPVVAVVGYTNAGKTSLIRALTGSDKLVPRNHLFATLDVTFHVGLLPCNLKAFYVDTIGFISDIPTHLIEPFRVTLADAMNADLVVHVQDVSRPDWRFQRDRVNETLDSLDIDDKLRHGIVSVANKTDLVVADDALSLADNVVRVSCADGSGIDALKWRLQDELIRITGRTHLIVRAKTGSDEYDWLHSEATVADSRADPKDHNYSLLSVIITETALTKFKQNFIRDFLTNL